MTISDEKKIREVQEEFNEKFPFLKLEFYTEEHEAEEGSPADQKIDPEKTVGEIRRKHSSGDLSINGNQKVSTLEKNFHDTYGLNAQVFRRSGDIWLQTTSTDDWTLAEQNRRGRV